MTLPRFYPIFDNADWLERLVPLGIKLVQLRMKHAEQATVLEHVRRAKTVCAAHDCTLVINDHWHVAIAEGCDWIHLGQEDLDTADTHAIRAAGLRLGISTHNRTELARALNLDPDYIALGPVYPTILKQMRWNPQGLDKLTLWRNLIGDIPLVAIGGMSTDRAPGAFASGANVVSAVTDITLHPDPVARIGAWLAATQ